MTMKVRCQKCNAVIEPKYIGSFDEEYGRCLLSNYECYFCKSHDLIDTDESYRPPVEYEKLEARIEARIEALEKHTLKTDLINFEKMMDMNNRITTLEQTIASLCKETIK